MQNANPNTFDPLDYSSLAKSMYEALMRSPSVPLEGEKKYQGYGVYALYYRGDHPAYSMISEWNKNPVHPCTWAIYVGKASANTRKGKDSRVESAMADRDESFIENEVVNPETYDPLGFGSNFSLSKRILEHRASIEKASNLRIEDFTVRRLLIAPVWTPMAEGLAIRSSRPVWNQALDGFGNHDPGRGRRNQARSPWDTLHPGRAWAERLPENPFSREHFVALVRSHQESTRPGL